ncbi:MAG: hypothetical protein DRG69_09435, partial [Deltaproteobacteria bacterium]
MKQCTAEPERQDDTFNEWAGVTITRFRLFGNPEIKDYLNNWYSKVVFKCTGDLGECQQYEDDPDCVIYFQECVDSNCDTLKYTYKCKIGEGEDIQVSQACTGFLRCMGTECKDASYLANQDFAQAAAAMEILNMYRADSTDVIIFPGEVQVCQRSPKDCCKSPGIGMSIGDY